MEDYHSAFNSDDISLLEKSVEKTLEHGCKECGFRYIIFTTNVSLEPNGTKTFFLDKFSNFFEIRAAIYNLQSH